MRTAYIGRTSETCTGRFHKLKKKIIINIMLYFTTRSKVKVGLYLVHLTRGGLISLATAAKSSIYEFL